MKTKKTKREFYTEILALTEVQENEGLKEFIEKQLEDLAKKAAKAKEKEKDSDILTQEVLDVLTAEFQTIAQVTAAVVANGVEDATSAKVSYRLNQLVKLGSAEKGEVKVDKSKLVGFKVPEIVETNEDAE